MGSIESLVERLVRFLTQAGPLGVFVGMLLESACIPLPSEVILPFAGFLVAQGRWTFGEAVLAGWLGQLAGSLLAYGAGRWGGRGLVMRYGRFFFVRERELERADRWFARYGDATAFLSRLLPGVRTFISLPAGIAGMPAGRFLVYSAAGALPWTAVLTYVGLQMGERWQEIRRVFERFNLVLVAIAVIGAAAYLWHRRARTGPRRSV